jgi:hypothetical protein
LKLLLNPDLYSGLSNHEQNKIRKLRELYNHNFDNFDVECKYGTEGELTQWVSLKHTGHNDGKGQSNWDSDKKQRFILRKGNNSPRYGYQLKYFIEKVDFIDEDTKEKFRNEINATNIERLISNQNIRTRLGFGLESRKLTQKYSDDYISESIKALAETLEGTKVRELYDKERTEEFFNKNIEPKLPREVEYVDKEEAILKRGENVKKSISRFEDSNKTEASKQKPSSQHLRHSSERKTVIHPNEEININETNTKDAFIELQKLDANKYPNAASVLFRILIEYSIHKYIAECNLKGKKQGSEKLAKKAERVINSLIEKNRISKEDGQYLQNMLNPTDPTQENFGSIKSFNQYVHNAEYHPNAQTMISSWESIKKLIKSIWNDVESV